jgi:hypothetical protein
MKVREIFLSLPHPFIRRIDATQTAGEVLARATAQLDSALLIAGLKT